MAIIGTERQDAKAGSSVIALPAFPLVAAGKESPRATNLAVDSGGRPWVFASTSKRVVVFSSAKRPLLMDVAGPGLVSHAVGKPNAGICYAEVDIGETQATGHQNRFVACVDLKSGTKIVPVPRDFDGVDELAAGPRAEVALLSVSGRQVARIVDGTTFEYRLETSRTVSGGLAIAGDGSVWFSTDTPAGPSSNVVQRLALDGTVHILKIPGYSASQILPSGKDGVIVLNRAPVGSMLVNIRMVSGSPAIVWRRYVPDAGSFGVTSDGSTWLVDRELGLVLYRLDARGKVSRVRRPDGAVSPITALTAHGSDVWYATLANNLVHLSGAAKIAR